MGQEITLSQLIKNLTDLKKTKDKVKKEINERLHEAYKEDIKSLMDRAVQEFYDDYPDSELHGYKRKKDLFNAYKVTARKNGHLSIETGAKFMKKRHRADNEYIYNMAFVSGWHGGAPYVNDVEDSVWGVPHPNPANYYGGDKPIDGGDLYWRTPMKPKEIRYSMWYNIPARQASISPMDRIEELLDEYEKTGYEDTLNKTVEYFLFR